MPIVDLIVAVCLISNPGACRDEHLYFESHGSLNRCMFEAMPTLAKWAGEHPQWRIVRFHCQWVDQPQQDT